MAICTSPPPTSTRTWAWNCPWAARPTPANTKEGTEFIPHRTKLAVPGPPGQTHLGDAGNDVTANYQWLHDRGAIAVFAYNRRNEHLDPEPPVEARLRSKRHALCPVWPVVSLQWLRLRGAEPAVCLWLAVSRPRSSACPHRYGVLGYCHRMTFKEPSAPHWADPARLQGVAAPL